MLISSLLCELAEALPAGGRLVPVLSHHAAGATGIGRGAAPDQQHVRGMDSHGRPQQAHPTAGSSYSITQHPTSCLPPCSSGCQPNHASSHQAPGHHSPQQGGRGAIRHRVAAAVAPHRHRFLKHGASSGPVAGAVVLIACTSVWEEVASAAGGALADGEVPANFLTQRKANDQASVHTLGNLGLAVDSH